jgi:calcineurin-like phosphoesterase family protein
MATFFTADWHLGETRMEILQRPFKDAEEHVSELLRLHNETVSPEDTVIMVGDAAYDPSWIERVKDFNGHKTLIKGNHDRKVPDEELTKYFERIVPEGDGLDMKQGGLPLWVTHYPTSAVAEKFNLVGHIHGAWKFQLNSLNVGVDVHHFRPVPIERIPFFFRAICEFYDDDVWAAYSQGNAALRGLRGKKGSYLQHKDKK